MNRRNMMLMSGAAALAATVSTPQASAEPEAPGQPQNPGAPPANANPAPAEFIFADDFDGPAGAPPDLGRWTVVGWNEPVTPPILGLFRDDRRNVSLDGNGNLVLRATREGDTYFSGRVETNMKIGIGHTWEARIKLNCLVPGCWPAYWLVNREPTPDGRGPLPDGEVDILEWYGNGKWAPGTSVHARSDGRTWKENRWPVDGAPYFTVASVPIDGVWPFNAPDYLLYTVFNLAVGGPGGGIPAFGPYETPEMLIDYVRIW